MMSIARLFELDGRSVRFLRVYVFCAVALCILAGVVVSAGDVWTFGGIDFRARLVGARLLWSGIDPYSYVWMPDDSLRFGDPIARYPGPSRATYPPPLLAFYGLFDWLPYTVQRGVWAMSEWAAFLMTAALSLRLIPTRSVRFLFVAAVIAFMASSHYWRLHVERGQYYVFIALLLAIELVLLDMSTGWRGRLRGVALGIACALRPTVGLVVLLLWLGRDRTMAVRALATAAVLAVLATLPVGGSMWLSYKANVDAISEWVDHYAETDYADRTFGPVTHTAPTVIEGYDLTRSLEARSRNATVQGLMDGGGKPLATALLLVWLCMSAAMLVWLGRCRASRRTVAFVSLVCMVVSDLFMPIRFGYADVLFLPLAALGMTLWPGLPRPVRVVVGLMAAIACVLSLPWLDSGTVTVARDVCMFVACGILALWCLAAARPHPSALAASA